MMTRDVMYDGDGALLTGALCGEHARQLWLDVTMYEGAWEVVCRTCQRKVIVIVLRHVNYLVARLRGHANAGHDWEGHVNVRLGPQRQIDATHSTREAHMFQNERKKSNAASDDHPRVHRQP